MSGPVSSDPPLLDLGGPEPRQPILVTGLAAAAVLAGTGELSLSWETRGADLEWGGVYAQGVRLTGPWTVRVTVGGRSFSLPETLDRLVAHRWGVESHHTMGLLRVTQEVVPCASAPAVLRRLSFGPAADPPERILVTSQFEPFLAPVLMEGVKPYLYHLETRGPTLSFRSHGFGATLDSDPLPHRLAVDGRPWIGGRHASEIREVQMEHELWVGSEGATLAWTMQGGVERSYPALAIRPNPTSRAGEMGRPAAAWADWTARTPQMSLPGDPLLETAYRLARGALRSLYTCPDGELTGLVAGYPWYSALWCRDLAWMLPAVLWMGDHEWAARSVRSVLRFQARASIPILAAEAGELPMQISPGPIFLYGTSDTTLYYPGIVRRLVDHSGRSALAEEFWPNLERIGAWAKARATGPSDLFRNGGEIEEVRSAASGLSRINYGFDAVDTTIWDSTDRRDHAVDVQALYVEALDALADLSGRRGDGGSARAFRDDADRITRAIGDRYWWPDEGYLYDSLHRDGTPVRKVRPNALRAVILGLLPEHRARAVLDRALRDDLAVPWGVRTLSARDPGFVPTAYHDGQVWTIATAWAAQAAFALGDSTRGLEWMRCNAERIVAERGLANECYRGDRPEPFDSCFLLGFSIAPFLATYFEGLWGLRAGPGASTLSIEPRLPREWSLAELRGLRIGTGSLDLVYRDGHIEARWSGPGTLQVRTAGEVRALSAGTVIDLPDAASSKGY